MCQGDCNDLMQLPTAPVEVINGRDGERAFLYVASADDSSGTGFNYPADETQEYKAFLSTTSEIRTPIVANFAGLWFKSTGVDGTNGTNGTAGTNGAISFEYNWSTATSTSDPGSTYLNINNASTALATTIVISNTEINSINIGNALTQILSTSTSTVKGYIQITKKGDSTKYAVYSVTAFTSSAGFKTITIVYQIASGAAPFANNDDVVLSVISNGDKGTTGAAGSTGAAGPGYLATSVTSNSISTGSKTFTTQAGLAYTVGSRARISVDENNYIEGGVTAYSGTTLTILSDYKVGSGTYSAWNINIAGDVGAAGSTRNNVVYSLGTRTTGSGVIASGLGTPGTGRVETVTASQTLSNNGDRFVVKGLMNISGGSTDGTPATGWGIYLSPSAGSIVWINAVDQITVNHSIYAELEYIKVATGYRYILKVDIWNVSSTTSSVLFKSYRQEAVVIAATEDSFTFGLSDFDTPTFTSVNIEDLSILYYNI